MGNSHPVHEKYDYTLPLDLLTEVFLYLDYKSLFLAVTVCQNWKYPLSQPRLFHDFPFEDIWTYAFPSKSFNLFLSKYHQYFRSVSARVASRMLDLGLPLNKLVSAYIYERSELQFFNLDRIIFLNLEPDPNIPLSLFPRLKYCGLYNLWKSESHFYGTSEVLGHPSIIALSTGYIFAQVLSWDLPKLKLLSLGSKFDECPFINILTGKIDLTIFPELEIFSALIEDIYVGVFTIDCPPVLRLIAFGTHVSPKLINGKSVKILPRNVTLGSYNTSKGKIALYTGCIKIDPSAKFLEWL